MVSSTPYSQPIPPIYITLCTCSLSLLRRLQSMYAQGQPAPSTDGFCEGEILRGIDIPVIRKAGLMFPHQCGQIQKIGWKSKFNIEKFYILQ